MKLVLLQVITILAMTFLTCMISFKIRKCTKGEEDVGETLWTVKVQQIGAQPKSLWRFLLRRDNLPNRLELPAGSYLAGNGMFNDIYMDAGKKPVRLYVNVQPDVILLSVLKGTIRMCDIAYRSNQKEQIVIENGTRIFVGNLQLKFIKEETGRW